MNSCLVGIILIDRAYEVDMFHFFFSPTGYANKLTHVFRKKFKGVVHAGRICRKNISYSLAPVQTETSGTTQYRTKHMIGHLNRDHKHFQITLT